MSAMIEKPLFRTGDAILHKPSGETWVCTWADLATGYLSRLGWPPGEAKISGFELAKAVGDGGGLEVASRPQAFRTTRRRPRSAALRRSRC